MVTPRFVISNRSASFLAELNTLNCVPRPQYMHDSGYSSSSTLENQPSPPFLPPAIVADPTAASWASSSKSTNNTAVASPSDQSLVIPQTPETPQKKRRGRPLGSKNKPKDQPSPPRVPKKRGRPLGVKNKPKDPLTPPKDSKPKGVSEAKKTNAISNNTGRPLTQHTPSQEEIWSYDAPMLAPQLGLESSNNDNEGLTLPPEPGANGWYAYEGTIWSYGPPTPALELGLDSNSNDNEGSIVPYNSPTPALEEPEVQSSEEIVREMKNLDIDTEWMDDFYALMLAENGLEGGV